MSTSTDTFAAAAQAVAAAILAAAVDPADAVRLLALLMDVDSDSDALNLSGFGPDDYLVVDDVDDPLAVDPEGDYLAATPGAALPESPVGQAIGAMADAVADLFRRAAVVALARAASSYEPASQDDALRVRNIVCALLDQEILIAGDQAEDSTYGALRSLRAAVADDLSTRGAALPAVKTFQANRPMPSLVWGQRIYRDSGRADELVVQANPVHPAFMPVRFRALSI